MFIRSLIGLVLLMAVAPMLAAQTGGQFDLSHNVVAGGGSRSTGGTITVEGTAGQAVAGIQSSNQTFSLRGGFWAFHQLIPTAAGVSISGQILAATGGGIRNVILTLTNAATGEIRTSRSSAFGHYRFDEIPVGQTYILAVTSKRYAFDPSSRLLILHDELTDEDFTALPE